MRPTNKSLFLVIPLLALSMACAPNHLPETTVGATTTVPQQQQNSHVVAAIVKAKKANLRDKPSETANVAGLVNKGDLLSLMREEPTGPWYQVRHSETGIEGWIHGNTIALLQVVGTPNTTSARVADTNSVSVQGVPAASPTKPDTPPPASRTSQSASGKSYVNVDGVRVPSPVFSDTRPEGASARCRDGSYSFSRNRRGTCSHHGGVALWY